MSTKAIREALKSLDSDSEWSAEQWSRMVATALAEVEAIEKALQPVAAKVQLSDIVHEMPDHCPMMITLPAGVWRALVKAVGP